MKNILILFACIICFFSIPLIAQVKLPSPSSTQIIKQDFGLGSIELTYSRPGAKGRMVFGDLVPYGKLWRTGANAATRLTFTNPVEIGGKKIDTGTYVLYTIPDVESWQVIINKGVNNWGIEGYNDADNIVSFSVPSNKMPAKIEIFTMQFVDIKPESCDLQLMWEKTTIDIPITTNIISKLRVQIETAMLTDKRPYWQAAQFYFEYDRNLTKALDNITKATEENPKAFYMFLYKAKIQKEMGNYAGAMESSKTSLALSKEANNDDYAKMSVQLQKEIKKAMK